MEDEIQTYLIGLKYFTTGAWPYYGNYVVSPNDELLTQDPGALQALLVGLPLKIWPDPLSPFLFLNLLSTAGFWFLGWTLSLRLPKLSPWFILPWVLTLPWCLHYSTGTLNLSYSIAGACVFFTAFLESLPSLRLGWIPLPLANALMGFCLFWNAQLHRVWVLLPPFILASLFLQWRRDRKITPFLFTVLGTLPLLALMIPTFLLNDYHFHRDVSGLSFGFNLNNFLGIFTLLSRFLSLASQELPRFLGLNTTERISFLSSQPLLFLPGAFLWIFGILQVVILMGFWFDFRNPRPDWKFIRLLSGLSFLLIYTALLFTDKTLDVNHYYEMLPVAVIYSLYVWERCWAFQAVRRFLWVFLSFGIIFQIGYVLVQAPRKESFYLKYREAIRQAIQSKDYEVLGKRWPGSLY